MGRADPSLSSELSPRRGRRMIKGLSCDILILHNIPGGSSFRPGRSHLMEIRAFQPSSGLVPWGWFLEMEPWRGLGRDGSAPTQLLPWPHHITALSPPLGPLPGAKDTEPPAQGPSCSGTRAHIDFQMSRKSKQTKALHYLQSSLELSVVGTHREELCSCSLPACIPIPAGDNTQTCTELEQGTGRKEGATCSQG